MQLDGRRRLLALAVLLPLVLVCASGGRASWFRCQLTGVVSADPCCPDEAADGDAAAPQPTVAAVDCCLRETVSFAHPPAEAAVAPAHEAGAVVTVAVGSLDPAPLPPSLVNFVRAARPDIVPLPPLRLVKRSLLI
jgi:hypothetical protein